MNGRRVRRGIAALVVLAIAPAQPAHAYLTFSANANGRTVSMKWAKTPVQYFVSDQGVPGVSANDLQAAVGRALASWQAVPTASIIYQFGGLTAAAPGVDDGMSTIGFQDHPEMDRVLASTSFITDETTGEILESDIFLNSEFAWSVAAAGEPGKYDVQSIALHETGHLSGLGHSALGETQLEADGSRAVIASDAIMFPIAYAAGSVAGRTLRADDIAGISSLYPDGGIQQADGSISGHVTKNGQPLYGAHVVAFDPATQTMVAGFTLNAQGQFSISGLSPGVHVLRVEPLDDADVDSFFDESLTPVNVDFRVTYADHLIVVPRGGDSGDVAVSVAAK